MAQDSEKRFHSIMDKLFHAPKSTSLSSPSSSPGVQSSGGKKRPYSTALGSMELNLRGDVAEGSHLSSAAMGTAAEGALCRPWDRSDFMRRLATFKSMSWFAKPKVVSAVNCARRGWINVDIDTIACEACRARLLFSTPASWNQQQVEKAALVFSLKLDNGHKLLCPWIDNACSETLARFPPTTPPVLVENFRERCSALLRLSALPRISSSVIAYMQSPLLQDFLGQSSMLKGRSGSAGNSEVESVSDKEELKLYYQAQKLISLCGWNLRSLPYIVDSKDVSEQSVKNATILDCSRVIADGENLETDESFKDSNEEQIDPNSAVLDCALCGATVGLWAFCMVSRPVESLRLLGYAEVNSEHDSVTQNRQGQGVNNTMSDVTTSARNISSSLNMTIAGGPPPTKQNFKAIISLPIIGQNLRARLSYDFDLLDHVFVDGVRIESDSRKKIRIQDEPETTVDASTGQLIPLSSENREISHCEASSPTTVHDSADGLNSSAAGGPSSSQKELAEDEALSLSQKTFNGVVNSLANYGVNDRVENAGNSEDQHCSLGRDAKQVPSDKGMEFDPIRHHRHFCPWIASIDDGEPGWKQTLSALYHQENHLPRSPLRSPTSSPIVKVDDPVGSVKKLFMSPSTRRWKLAQFSSQNTEHR